MDAHSLGCSGSSSVTTATANGIRHDGPAGYATNGHVNDAAITRNGPQCHVATATNDVATADDAAVDDDVAAIATAVDAVDASYAKLAVTDDEPGLQSANANATTSV